MEKSFAIHYREYASQEELQPADRKLMDAAIAATESAYAPYSRFHVGCALRLANGTIVSGSNQENAAYPSGLCAERTALFAAASTHPGIAIEHLCVVARNTAGVLTAATPCGACLQVMAETRQRQQKPLAVTLYLDGGGVRQFDDIDALLPFAFSLEKETAN